MSQHDVDTNTLLGKLHRVSSHYVTNATLMLYYGSNGTGLQDWHDMKRYGAMYAVQYMHAHMCLVCVI